MKPLLKEMRKAKGLTQEQLAERLGVKLATYRTWERGTTNMSFPQAVACADALGCTLDELVGRNSTPANETARKQQQEEANLVALYRKINDETSKGMVFAVAMLAADVPFNLHTSSENDDEYQE